MAVLMNSKKPDVTKLLIRVNEGEQEALQELLPMVYDNLLAIARNQLNREYGDHTLNKADLVHEVFIRLAEGTSVDWQNRGHFYAVAAKAMRQILTDYARKKVAQKRGGKSDRITLDEHVININKQAEELIEIDEALEDLFLLNDRLAKIVELRFYAGLSMQETGNTLGISEKTVSRDWAKARAWLFKRLKSAS